MSITTPHPSLAAQNRTPPTLARLVGGAARGASRRPKLTILLWLALVLGCLVAGGLSGTRQLSNAASGTGESAAAEAQLHHAGLIDPATENIMVTANTRAQTATAVAALRRARRLPSVATVALILIWAMAGSPDFWPIWATVSLAALWGAHWTARIPRRRSLEVRVDELKRTRSGALDVQASELRRIERDLHDGAQARLVALSMQLGRAEERLADDPDTAALVRRAREEATAAIGELRNRARGSPRRSWPIADSRRPCNPWPTAPGR